MYIYIINCYIEVNKLNNWVVCWIFQFRHLSQKLEMKWDALSIHSKSAHWMQENWSWWGVPWLVDDPRQKWFGTSTTNRYLQRQWRPPSVLIVQATLARLSCIRQHRRRRSIWMFMLKKLNWVLSVASIKTLDWRVEHLIRWRKIPYRKLSCLKSPVSWQHFFLSKSILLLTVSWINDQFVFENFIIYSRWLLVNSLKRRKVTVDIKETIYHYPIWILGTVMVNNAVWYIYIHTLMR